MQVPAARKSGPNGESAPITLCISNDLQQISSGNCLPAIFWQSGCVRSVHREADERRYMSTSAAKPAPINDRVLAEFPPDISVFGESPAMQVIRQKIEKVSVGLMSQF